MFLYIFVHIFLDVHKPVFVATKEWQEIKEGQKVPSGLHYRMNLETGKKEAKLMETENDKGMSNHMYIKGVDFIFEEFIMTLS